MTQPSFLIILAGSGRITVGNRGRDVALSELSSAYPLKLLSPRAVQSKVAVVYVLTYGGGLVGGDQLKLQADLEYETVLALLSQGSTKVFKTRPGHRLASVGRPSGSSATLPVPASNLTSQTFSFNIASRSTLALLMEPVTCFRSASYSQVQTFHLEDEQSSLVVIDWITSGRKAIGEEWSFSRYYSCNEIWVGRRRIMRDVVLLEDDCEDRAGLGLPAKPLLKRMAPYGCYATVFFYGPKLTDTVAHLTKEYEAISIFKGRWPEKLLWSLSSVTPKEQTGAVLRVAAIETEMVKKWLSNALREMEKMIGADVYQRAFA